MNRIEILDDVFDHYPYKQARERAILKFASERNDSGSFSDVVGYRTLRSGECPESHYYCDEAGSYGNGCSCMKFKGSL